MALSKEAIRADYPLPVYNYRVTVGSTTMSFSEVSGLQADYDVAEYRHGFSFLGGINIVRGFQKTVTISMKRGIVHNRRELWQWVNDNEQQDISIELCDEAGVPLIRWKVTKAVPVKLDAPSFSADSNDVAVESLDWRAYDVKIEYL